MQAAIAGLFVYPIKSCRGTAATTTVVTERGVAHDREWMIVDSHGRFITQREEPRLALIAPTLERTLRLSAPGMDTIEVPLDATCALVSVRVFRDTVRAFDQGDAVSSWLSRYLIRDVRLVRFDPSERRYCNPAFAGDSGAHTSFADGYPVLVIAQDSLTDLNRRLAEPLPMNRFRPNIVLAGIDAYDEDHIDFITAKTVTLRLVKPCVRCKITTTDQATASVGIEPLPTLAGYRRDDALGGPAFGMNAIVESGSGDSLSIGDSVHCNFNF
jgi:MOSC domain-containing protein